MAPVVILAAIGKASIKVLPFIATYGVNRLVFKMNMRDMKKMQEEQKKEEDHTDD